MIITAQREDKFCDYFRQWVSLYKEGSVKGVTLSKYLITINHLRRIAPKIKLKDLNRNTYQQIINEYALTHEKQTTMDFHHQLKGAILDAVDEGLIDRDPTRKVIIKGKHPKVKKTKFINQFELQTLIKSLDLGTRVNWYWFILLIAKTGIRFSEALAITPNDFDFNNLTLNINKTWDYKANVGFQSTKNKSSIRKIQLDWRIVSQFSNLTSDKKDNDPIFVSGKLYNSTINSILEKKCKEIGIPVITIHGLRHTHASLLLFSGVSIASVARRLGHSSISTTQSTYIHIIHEMESQDTDLIIRALSKLN